MQDAFGTVVFVVVAVGVVVALVTVVGTARSYRQIGGGGLTRDSDDDPGAGAIPSADAERDEEIRQMLDARNARRERRGEVPVDVDAELARLTQPTVDPGLREEVRAHVVARNRPRSAGSASCSTDAKNASRSR